MVWRFPTYCIHLHKPPRVTEFHGLTPGHASIFSNTTFTSQSCQQSAGFIITFEIPQQPLPRHFTLKTVFSVTLWMCWSEGCGLVYLPTPRIGFPSPDKDEAIQQRPQCDNKSTAQDERRLRERELDIAGAGICHHCIASAFVKSSSRSHRTQPTTIVTPHPRYEFHTRLEIDTMRFYLVVDLAFVMEAAVGVLPLAWSHHLSWCQYPCLVRGVGY